MICDNGMASMQSGKEKAQSAMEYLISYGWMILIIAVVLAALYFLGIFSPNSLATSSCVLPGQFSCSIAAFGTNGGLQLNVGQYTQSQVTITSIGCSTNQTANYQTSESQNLNVGSNATFVAQCYSGSSAFNGSIGSIYHGYLIINYTDKASGLTHTISGPVTLKVEASPILQAGTYVYGGNSNCMSVTSCSTTLASGYNWYFCGGGGASSLSSVTWTSDEAISYISQGHQTSNTCSVSQSSSTNMAAGGVGVVASSYTLEVSGQSSSTSFSFSWTPSAAKAEDFVVITSEYVPTVTLPSGCTKLDDITSGGNYIHIYIALCKGYSSYSISGTLTIAPESWAVYDIAA